MDIGFTGTQRGITNSQKAVLLGRLALMASASTTAHHGQCVGADAAFHGVCIALQIPIIGHPPINQSKRAKLSGFLYEWEPKEYLDRNKDIVRCSDLLIATPAEEQEQLRSGTWSTIRFARKIGVPRYIIYPDGRVDNDEVENR